MAEVFVVTTHLCTNSYILFISFFKKLNICIFPIAKKAANYAEIGRVGKFGAGFQQLSSTCSDYLKLHNIVLKHLYNN